MFGTMYLSQSHKLLFSRFQKHHPSMDYPHAFKVIDIILGDTINRSCFGEDDIVSLVNIYNCLRDSGFIDRYIRCFFDCEFDKNILMYLKEQFSGFNVSEDFLKIISGRIKNMIEIKKWVNEIKETIILF